MRNMDSIINAMVKSRRKKNAISQREARKLRRRVQQLEQVERERRSLYGREYPGGVHIASYRSPGELCTIVYTAQKLGQAIVVRANGNSCIEFYALPHPSMPL